MKLGVGRKVGLAEGGLRCGSGGAEECQRVKGGESGEVSHDYVCVAGVAEPLVSGPFGAPCLQKL